MKTSFKIAATAIGLSLTGISANAQSIVEIAAGDARFSTLVAAVQAAGLVEVLSGPGPFTVFAPVNDAFAALPAGTVETLLLAENRAQLVDILMYHVDDGALMSGMIPTGITALEPLLADNRLCVTNNGDGVMIADGTGTMATVVIADIVADNGVIHVIDKVLLPGNAPDC